MAMGTLVLAVGMLIAGSLNTIAYKVADWQTAPGVYNWNQCNWSMADEPSPPPLPPLPPPPIPGQPCTFVHPFFQVYAMFLGESICLVAFVALRFAGTVDPAPSFNWIIFLPCALCDMCGTSLMLLGLLLTYASNFQMLRGSVVLFTGILSRLFLGRKLSMAHWSGMLLVLGGTAVVGLDDVLHPQTSASASNPPLGNLLIVVAQVIVAVQFVLEEKFVSSQNIPPLMAVGLEGVFGFAVLSVALAAMYYVPGVQGLSETPIRMEDLFDALRQLGGGNTLLVTAMAAAVLSIAFYNFFGISVTKELSAAHRMVLDSTRTIVVWVFSLTVHALSPASSHGQAFSYLQLVGFVILVCGSLVYYEVVPLCKPRAGTATATDPLLVINSQ